MLPRHPTAVLAAALFAALVPPPPFATAAGQPTQDATGAPPGDANAPAGSGFKGKVIFVATDAHAGAVLEQAQVRQLGGRSFVVGKSVDDGRTGPYKGQTLWIAAERIVQIVEFASVEEMRKVYEAAPQAPAPAPAPVPVPPTPTARRL